MARYMNLLTDYAFKFVFGSEKHKNIVINKERWQIQI